MDMIKELTNRRNAFSNAFTEKHEIKRAELFLLQANNDIREINKLIEQYNGEQSVFKKQNALNKIESKFQAILSTYPDQFMAYFANFSKQIHYKLFNEIKNERANLALTSKHPTNTLPHIIENMSPDKVSQLMETLIYGSLFDPSEFYNLYTSADPIDDYNNFQAFLSTITEIKFLGGGNSKNFKIIYPNGDALVLKLENRLDMPSRIEHELQSGVLKDVLTPVHVRRPGNVTYSDSDKKNHTINRSLVVTDFCRGRDLEFHGNIQFILNQRIQSALNIYTQMGKILTHLTEHKYAFPDMKNTNWLIENNGSLRIADTKSFIYLNENRHIDFKVPGNEWSTLPNSAFLSPPEIINYDWSDRHAAEKIHVYMLGKNIYQYLTNADADELYKNQFSFELPVFKTEEGMQLKELIEATVKPNPTDRLPMADVLKKLSDISNIAIQKAEKALEAKRAREAQKAIQAQKEKEALLLTIQTKKNDCNAILDEILTCRFGKHDQKMDDFETVQRNKIKDAKDDLASLTKIHEHLNSILAMNKNDGITQLKNYLSSLKQSPMYYFDITKKYKNIKEAILNIPIEERGHMQTPSVTTSLQLKILKNVLQDYCDPTWLKAFYRASTPDNTKQFKEKYKMAQEKEVESNTMTKKIN